MLSVAASIGLFGFCQVPATLIIFEILPFLVLAVGVDNIFIMVDGFQKSEPSESELDYEHLGRVMGEVTPSMFVSSAAQVRTYNIWHYVQFLKFYTDIFFTGHSILPRSIIRYASS